MQRVIPGLFIAGLLSLSSVATGTALRHASFPDVSESDVVFVYRDAVWIVPLAGGNARLLSDVGTRPRHPKFSPDGSHVAYSATRDGNRDVFVVNVSGGPIRRATNHPARDDLIDWHVDGKRLLFKSTMESPRAVYNRLFVVAASGGLPAALPLPYVETAAMSPDGRFLVFSYLRDFQEEVWKRYLGGRAPDLWQYDFATGNSRKLTTNPAPDSVPMLHGDDVYYLSERGTLRRSNLWVLKEDDRDARQVTNFDRDDVRHPSIGPAGIVFEAGGLLYIQDLSGNKSQQLSIDLSIARDEKTPRWVSLADRIEGASIGPDHLIAIESRGEVVIYDTGTRLGVNTTSSSSAAERYPSISHSGTQVAYQSDESGEYQLNVRDLESGTARQLTQFQSGFRYRPFWSPDDRFLVFMDQEQIIWLVEVRTGAPIRVDQGRWRYHWDMPQFRISWSPDSRWFAWSRGGENRNQSIYAYDVSSKRRHQLTSGFYSDFDPVFDPTGNYIAAVGYRSFKPTFGDIDPTFTYADSMVVTILPLTKEIGAPGDVGWRMPEARQKVDIDSDDIESRLRVLPFAPGRFSMPMFASGDILVSGSDGETTEVRRLALGEEESVVAWSGQRAQVLDATRRGILVRNEDGQLRLLDVDADADEVEIGIEAQQLSANIDPHLEFLQMFDDSWRYQRDFYYDPGMHGIDWEAMKAHYRPLAAAAHNEQELTSVIREMHGELAAGHVYVSAEPPYNRSDATDVGLLGVDFAVSDGAYVIKTILRPGVRRPLHRSPLDNPALGVEEGSFLLAVNGRRLSVGDAPWGAFRGLADTEVELTIADSAVGRNSRSVRVRTLSSERKLRELVWVENTRRRVEQASDGKVGYIYVPNTGAEGQNELMQMYRAQFHKAALIIDERFNTGGALGDRFVELLNRPPLNYFSSRNAEHYPLPELSHRGPKALLINSWSYSGGDGFPFLFKTAGVGPLVGTRTWGGLIGPGMRMSLINGGFISAPPQRVYDVHGNWAEGNEGVRPDVAIQNNPGELASGTDEQLMFAVKLLLEKIESMPDIVVPAFPERTPLEGAGE